jgi:hypothetical protein
LNRIVFTVRRTAHIVVASVALELALDFGVGAAAVVAAPYVGEWVYAVAGVIVIGSLPCSASTLSVSLGGSGCDITRKRPGGRTGTRAHLARGCVAEGATSSLRCSRPTPRRDRLDLVLVEAYAGVQSVCSPDP